MDEKYHLTWANAGATVRNVSRPLTAVFILVRPRSGPSARAIRALKRRISDVVYRRLLADAQRTIS